MSTNLHSKSTHDASSARTTTAIRVVLGLSLTAACFLVFADDRAVDASTPAAPAFGRVDLDLDPLERAFWACDHAATKYGVAGTDGAACGAVTDQFMTQKFDGDFEAMLGWWRERKATVHQAFDAAQEGTAAADELPMP